MSLTIVVEGETDRPVAQKLAQDAGIACDTIVNTRGKQNLDRDLRRYNQAARVRPWFVLRDVDSDQRCAGTIVTSIVGVPERWMTLRLAMREMESWLLADVDAMASFLGVRPSKLPNDPDAERDPKQLLVNLARHSPSRDRRSMAPLPDRSSQVGPQYAREIILFATKHWSPERAEKRSESLRRARAALRSLAKRWRHHAGR